jgi:diguanylate cyclase (GGDEF)-like protein
VERKELGPEQKLSPRLPSRSVMKRLIRMANDKIRDHAPVLAAGIVGFVVSVSIWYLMIALGDRAFIQEFSERAQNQVHTLQSGIDDYWDRLYALRALFETQNKAVTREEFEGFSRSFLNGYTAIMNVAWLPRVRREERAAHELAGARDGLPDYHIRSVGPAGSLPISPERDEYFPKFYSTEGRDSRVYGLDLNDETERGRMLAHIRDEGILSTSGPLLLHIGEGDRRGFIAGVPVYAPGLPHETVEDRRSNLLGIVQGVFQIRVMLDTVLAGGIAPVRLYVFTPHAGGDDPSDYSISRRDGRPVEAKSQAELMRRLHWVFPLNFGDLQWTLVVVPDPSASVASAGPWIVLVCGLLLTGTLTSFLWAMRRDARRLTAANERFEQQNLRFDAALSNMMQGLLMYDRLGRLVVSNRRFAQLFGVQWEKWEAAALGMTVPQSMRLVHELTNVTEKNQSQIMTELENILARGGTGKIIFERTDEHTFSAACTPMTDGGFVVTFEDVTEHQRAEQKISHMAHHDALTDLPNRVQFYEKLDEVLRRAPQGVGFAILSLDLDRFKSVNDTLGHPVGDRLLQAVAGRMRRCVRESDIVARLGGDEFAVVQVEFRHPEDASSLATRLIDAVSAPYQIDGHQIMVGTSIGIAIAPNDGIDTDLLMTNADLALYRAKSDGGSVYRFFETQMDASTRARRPLEIDLRKALVSEEFSLDYQPIVNIDTGRITACEALIRWRHPERGNIPPLEFIPIAEKTGLIVQIGEWVLRRACSDAAQWPDEFTVAVNVSPAQFRSANFMQVVTKALELSRLPARRLEVEITELVLMQDDSAALALLRQLKNLGVSIAIDDFGTGYSSLGYLRSFPFDQIKIDQSFIRDLSENKDSLAILRAVVGLGRSLGIVTTAEGVETEKQLEILRTEGCTQAQGFLFRRPISAAEVKNLLTPLGGQAKAVA